MKQQTKSALINFLELYLAELKEDKNPESFTVKLPNVAADWLKYGATITTSGEIKENSVLYELLAAFYYKENLIIPKGTQKTESEWYTECTLMKVGDIKKLPHLFKKVQQPKAINESISPKENSVIHKDKESWLGNVSQGIYDDGSMKFAYRNQAGEAEFLDGKEYDKDGKLAELNLTEHQKELLRKVRWLSEKGISITSIGI